MELGQRVKRWLKRPVVYRSLLAGAAGVLIVQIWRSLPPSVKITTFLAAIRANLVLEINDYGSFLTYKTAEGWFRTSAENLDKAVILEKASEAAIEYSDTHASRQAIEFICKIGLVVLPLAGLVYLQTPSEQPKKALQHSTAVYFKDIAGNEKAKQALSCLPDSHYKTAMSSLADFSVSRLY